MNEIIVILLLYFNCSLKFIIGNRLTDVNLPPNHLPYYFNTYRKVLEEICAQNIRYDLCNKKNKLESCWGYELNCDPSNSYRQPFCPDYHNEWSKREQFEVFYKQGDFGYIREQRNELTMMCKATSQDDSSLECSNHLRFCKGRNIFMNFSNLVSYKDPIRYNMDVLKDGEIGGYCNLFKAKLKEACDHLSPLQSWGPELQHFTSLHRQLVPQDCDVVVKEPTFIMKIDAAMNMYHHFCDFFNLYASLHVNSSHESAFSNDVRILIWESYTYQSAFSSAFEAFTKYPIWDLKFARGKTICFKNVVFPLLPRMIFGLYYNTPLISGCERSGLFQAFSHHMIHRLNIPFQERRHNKIRITFLSRNTMYRKVLNELQLLRAINNHSNYVVNRVIFDQNVPFKKQLEIVRNTDILISMHGAGLTHLLFLPDWAVVFELYNCEDINCYKDLARLRGVKYITWEDNYKLYPQEQSPENDKRGHAKFTNYKFDVNEFVRLVRKAEDYILDQDLFPADKKEFHDEL